MRAWQAACLKSLSPVTMIPTKNQTAAGTSDVPMEAWVIRCRSAMIRDCMRVTASCMSWQDCRCGPPVLRYRQICDDATSVSAFAIREFGADPVPNVPQPLDVPHRVVNRAELELKCGSNPARQRYQQFCFAFEPFDLCRAITVIVP